MIWLVFGLGVCVGIVVCGVVALKAMPSLMIIKSVSAKSFDETLEGIQNVAKAAGWKVPIVHPISETIRKEGFESPRLSVMELCQAELASRILKTKKGLDVSAFMPCRVAICEKPDGTTVMVRMNSSLMSKMFGADVAAIMGEAAQQNEAFFSNYVKN